MPNQQNLHDTYVTDKGTVAFNPNGVEAFRVCASTRRPQDANGIKSIEDLTNPDIAALFDSNGDGPGRALDRRARLGFDQCRKGSRQVLWL